MKWELERWVKVYRRDTAEWLALSWQAHGLFYELLRKADRNGHVAVGRLEPAVAVALLVRGEAGEVAAPLAELLRDGCVVSVGAEGSVVPHLAVRNYAEAQATQGAGAERMRRHRQGKAAYRDACDASDDRGEETRVAGEDLFPAADAPGEAEALAQELRPEPSKPRRQTDARFAPLRQAWEAEFKASTGGAYRWSVADSVGVKRVLAVPVEEFRARAKRALRATGFMRANTVAKLTSGEVWNGLATAASAAAGGKPRVIAAAGEFTDADGEDFFR